MRSEFINEVVEGWDSWLEALSLSDSFDDCVGFRAFFLWISTELLPVIKYALWECSSCSGCSKGLGETEGFSYWKMALHVHEWSTSDWIFTNDDTSSLGHGLIDGTDAVIRSLDFDQEDGLLQSGGGGEIRGIEASSGCWDDLATTSVDSISMKSNIMDTESAASHVLIGHWTFLSCPLESSFD
jgi:hypothetical protein